MQLLYFFADSTTVSPSGDKFYNDPIYIIKSGAFVELTDELAAIWETSVYSMEDIPF